jgi:hypothetical protein
MSRSIIPVHSNGHFHTTQDPAKCTAKARLFLLLLLLLVLLLLLLLVGGGAAAGAATNLGFHRQPFLRL